MQWRGNITRATNRCSHGVGSSATVFWLLSRLLVLLLFSVLVLGMAMA